MSVPGVQLRGVVNRALGVLSHLALTTVGAGGIAAGAAARVIGSAAAGVVFAPFFVVVVLLWWPAWILWMISRRSGEGPDRAPTYALSRCRPRTPADGG